MDKKEMKERFERISAGAFSGLEVIVDKKTGVQYLLATSSSSTGSGLTPLIDANGRPLLFEQGHDAAF